MDFNTGQKVDRKMQPKSKQRVYVRQPFDNKGCPSPPIPSSPCKWDVRLYGRYQRAQGSGITMRQGLPCHIATPPADKTWDGTLHPHHCSKPLLTRWTTGQQRAGMSWHHDNTPTAAASEETMALTHPGWWHNPLPCVLCGGRIIIIIFILINVLALPSCVCMGLVT